MSLNVVFFSLGARLTSAGDVNLEPPDAWYGDMELVPVVPGEKKLLSTALGVLSKGWVAGGDVNAVWQGGVS